MFNRLSRRVIDPRVTQMKKETAIGGVLIKDLLPQTSRTQMVRKEMDQLKNALKEKIDRSVDRMVRATNSPFTTAVL